MEFPPQEERQAFRPIYKNNGNNNNTHSSTLEVHSDLNIIYITPKYDPEIDRDVIFWEDVLHEFQDALYIRDRFNPTRFIQDVDKKILDPLRISIAPGVVLNVIVENPVSQDSTKSPVIEDLGIPDISRPVRIDVEKVNNIESSSVITSTIASTPTYSQNKSTPCPDDTDGSNHSWLLQPRDKTRGLGLTIEMANAGCADSQYDIGTIYDLFHLDWKGAIEWYHKAAIQGHARAQQRMGYHYYLGYGVKSNNSLAKRWYFKAAEQNEPVAQNGCGILYKEGKAFPVDHPKAMEWYLKSAEQGYSNAQRNIGCLYASGLGVPQNYSKAMEWHLKAASQGNNLAQNNIGVFYHNGHGVSRDYLKALEWYRKAADQGDHQAQRNIGILYHGGYGITSNPQIARKWFLKSANQGNPQAQNELGRIYHFGSDVPIDIAKAIKWYNRAAKQGHAISQYRIGLIHSQGNGVPLNYSKALDFFQMSATSGNLDGRYYLASHYDEGRGTPFHPQKAKEWYKKSEHYLTSRNVKKILRREKKNHRRLD
ncbi:hypothetical protein BGZ76_000649 [Entomortierella beljakovae]|nr:hypothetical protein BGZ76_000649 [Entomortierella beljakovae]